MMYADTPIKHVCTSPQTGIPSDLVSILLACFIFDHLPELHQWLHANEMRGTADTLRDGGISGISMWLNEQNHRHVSLTSVLRDGVLPEPFASVGPYAMPAMLAERIRSVLELAK